MHLAYRGSVNRWECDENDHLNVRFYMAKLWETLTIGLADLGLVEAGEAETLLARVTIQHIRFLREARLAAPLSGYAAVVGQDLVLTELRDSFTDEVACAALHSIEGIDLGETMDIPEHAAPRGIEEVELPHAALDLAAAKRHRFATIGRGIIQPAECAGNGLLRNEHYMARFSDSMPHLWGAFHQESASEGGAVLEYRLRYHAPLRKSERYELVSGVADVGAKVQQFAHLLFNLETGRVAVSAQSVGVRLDLGARRAVTLGAEAQARMRERAIRPVA